MEVVGSSRLTYYTSKNENWRPTATWQYSPALLEKSRWRLERIQQLCTQWSSQSIQEPHRTWSRPPLKVTMEHAHKELAHSKTSNRKQTIAAKHGDNPTPCKYLETVRSSIVRHCWQLCCWLTFGDIIYISLHLGILPWKWKGRPMAFDIRRDH